MTCEDCERLKDALLAWCYQMENNPYLDIETKYVVSQARYLVVGFKK